MTIELKNYDDEAELHNWVEKNISSVFGEVIYIPGNFFIKTKRDKGVRSYYNRRGSIFQFCGRGFDQTL